MKRAVGRSVFGFRIPKAHAPCFEEHAAEQCLQSFRVSGLGISQAGPKA